MHPVEGMTKQGVRNLNNLGPKRKKVDAAEQEAQAQTADEPAGQTTDNASATVTDAPAVKSDVAE